MIRYPPGCVRRRGFIILRRWVEPLSFTDEIWGDIDPSEYIPSSGGEAGAFQLSYQEWVHSRAFFVERGEAVHRMAKIFKGVFFPFISNPLLEVLLAMPKQEKY